MAPHSFIFLIIIQRLTGELAIFHFPKFRYVVFSNCFSDPMSTVINLKLHSIASFSYMSLGI